MHDSVHSPRNDISWHHTLFPALFLLLWYISFNNSTSYNSDK